LPATALVSQKKFREAVPYFKEAIRLGSDIDAPYLALGLGNYSEAIPYLKTALRLRCGNPMARQLFRQALVAQK